MKKDRYTVRAEVWRYPGFAGWHFVSVPEAQSKKIADEYKHVRKGWGSLPIEITIGKTTWKTSIFPSKEGKYLLAIKAEVRKIEKIGIGDRISFTFRIRA